MSEWRDYYEIYGDQINVSNGEYGTFIKTEMKPAKDEEAIADKNDKKQLDKDDKLEELLHIIKWHKSQKEYSKYDFEYCIFNEKNHSKLRDKLMNKSQEATKNQEDDTYWDAVNGADYGDDHHYETLTWLSMLKDDDSIYEETPTRRTVSKEELIKLLADYDIYI